MTTQKKISDETSVRFAIYCRYSDEVQSDISLESQEAMCREEITRRKGIVVAVYKDAAQVGWTIDRDGFIRLRADAAQRKFDAVMMWKFDRLARDHVQVTVIKALLRHEYGIKLHCVEGFSEDDDNNPNNAIMEQMISIFSAFYSENLSSEVRRANRHRYASGKFNGGKPPFGYVLATEKKPKRPNCFQATVDKPPGLYIEPVEAELVHYAFKLYASGDHSYRSVAVAMTEKAHILNYPLDKPFNPQMIRELLQNRIYCGFVSHVETIYQKGFRQGKASRRGRQQWTQGIHEPIVSQMLFDEVQKVRVEHAQGRKGSRSAQTSLLSGLIYCAKCLAEKPSSIADASYGKMYSHVTRVNLRYYECSATSRGYENCGQAQVRQETIEQQVVNILCTLHERLPQDVIQHIESTMCKNIEHAAAMRRMEEINKVVERIDFSWESGFMDSETYLQKRQQLQVDVERLGSDEYSEQTKSFKLLQNFSKLWAQCTTLFAKQDLIKQIIEQVLANDGERVALVLKDGTVVRM